MKIAGNDLTTLRVFDAVVRHGGFVAAQRELDISLSTISNHIRALEDRLGVKVCHRGREGFRLTEQGEIVIVEARRLLIALDDFALQASDLRRQLLGQLRIGLVDSIATDPQLHLSDAIARFKRIPNAVSIEITQAPPHALQQAVRSGDRHLGIGSFPHKEKGLHYEPLYTERHSLYCAPGHRFFATEDARITPAAARAEGIVSRGYWRQEFVTNLGFENIGALVYQIEPQLLLIRSGEYLGFLPDHYAQRWVDAGQLRAVLPKAISYTCTFDLITRKGAQPSRMVQTFLAMLRQAQGVAR
jgi:LysR family transcriptional regulator, transcriptional activator for bauABCD operon